MNENYCLTCFMQYHEQVKIISRHVEKDNDGTVLGNQPSRCLKRRHLIKGAGLTLVGLKELDRFYGKRKS